MLPPLRFITVGPYLVNLDAIAYAFRVPKRLQFPAGQEELRLHFAGGDADLTLYNGQACDLIRLLQAIAIEGADLARQPKEQQP